MKEKIKKKISLREIGTEKIILLAAAGVLLLVINFSDWKTAAVKKEGNSKESVEDNRGNDAYVESLENKLVHILESVDGVGKVKVMVTLKSSKESVLNKDLSEESDTQEEKSEGTSKKDYNHKKEEETILSDKNGNSAPYVVKELEPEISGIVIACEGGDDNVVASSVKETVQVLFGIEANHIKVLKLEGSE
ncbi:MAG: stage III sporulation protein AG [Lachnospiraceae bacterium]|nr:stage III sporulation protein AG [Lachnospiraceae bacterium]MDY5497505.1 stage III sporulation protein AG [Anaerobutyricum sp.]